MYRNEDFEELFDFFTDTLGSEEGEGSGLIEIFEHKRNGNYGLDGDSYVKKCDVVGITLFEQPDASITTEKGQQNKTTHTSLRCNRGDLTNCYFFKDKRCYKILDFLSQNATQNGAQWFHYSCIEDNSVTYDLIER